MFREFLDRFRRPKRYTYGEYIDDVVGAMNERTEQPPNWWIDEYCQRQLEQRISETKARHGAGVPSFPSTALVFGEGQPSVFFDNEPGLPYRGQLRAKQRIDIMIEALSPEERLKFLLTGPAGTGKTALAWIAAQRIMQRRMEMFQYDGRFFEILPSMIENKPQLDAFMGQLRANDIVFLDEVHILKDAVGVEPLYHVLADTGTPRYPLGAGEGWIELPSGICWLAATTEPGKLDNTTGGALRRRLEPEVRLEPPTQEDLAAIVSDQGLVGFPIHVDAAWEIAERSGGLPWQALRVYSEAKAVAKSQDDVEITVPNVLQAFDAIGIDENGLMPEDRDIVAVLLSVQHRLANGRVVHRMNEGALCAAAGVDTSTFKSRVQPKLMRMGYLTTVGGQTLTEKALLDYAYLRASG